MRVHQLGAHLSRFFGDTYDVRFAPISNSKKLWVRAWVAAQPRGQIYIFSKNAAHGWSEEHLDQLRQKSRALLIDYVDAEMRFLKAFGADAHLSTSVVGAQAMQDQLDQVRASGAPVSGEVHTVLHNYDPAIDAVSFEHPDSLQVAFFGTRRMAVTTPEIEEKITFLPADSPEAFQDSVHQIGRFNCHYCVRKGMGEGPTRSFRPFTKGVTAAACESVILTNRDCDDAVELLGDDYPFMIPDLTPDALNAGMAHLEDSFGGPVWQEALDRVIAFKDRTTHQAITGQLHTAIQSVVR